MARKNLELQLLDLRFKHYTADVRECISRVVSSDRCEDTSDSVIDALWKTCPDEIAALLAKSGVDQRPSERGDAAPEPEARETIRTFIDGARSFEAELGDLEDDDFETLYRTTIDPIVRAKRDRRARSARENDRWAFFNTPEADADFARWRDRLLTPAQAVALSFGKDPDVVTPESLEPYRRVGGSPFREAFKDRLDLIEAAAAAGELSVPMSVSTFTQWATARGFAPPPKLTGEAANVLGEDAAFWRAKYEAAQSELEHLKEDLDGMWPKSRASIYKVILGMALARFEHKTVDNTKATSAISDAVKDMNHTINEGTILTLLEEAATKLEIHRPEAITWSRYRKSPT